MTLNNSLEALYHFTGNANDSSGNGNNGTVSGATLTTDKNSVADQAYDFNGSSNKINISNKIISDPVNDDFSFSSWVYLDNFSSNMCIYSQTNTSDANKFFNFTFISSNSNLYLSIRNGSGNDRQYKNNITFSTGQWYHIVVTKTGTDPPTFYINGVADTTTNVITDSISNPTTNSNDIGVNVRTSPGNWFDGKIDEPRIYSRALTDYEILQLYVGYDTDNDSVGTLEEDLEALYHFTGNANDSSGNGNNGTVNDATLTTDKESVSNQAYDFDGVDDNINCGSDSSIDEIFQSGGSINVWAYINSDGEANLGTILNKTRWGLRTIDESGGQVRLDFYSSKSTTNGVWQTDSRYDLNTWIMITITYDATSTSNDPVFYINGSSVAITETSTPAGNYSADAAFDLVIGSYSTIWAYDGKLDEVRVYSRELTQDEVLQLYVGYDTDDSSVVTLTLDNEAYYKLDVDSSSQTDSTGNGNTGTVTGATYTSSGKINGAYSFDGINDNITIPYNSDFVSSNFSLQAWVNPDTNGALNYIIDQQASTGNLSFILRIELGVVKFYIYSGSFQVVSSSTTLSTGTWYHIVATADSSGNLKMYINGILENTTTSAGVNLFNTQNIGIGQQLATSNFEFDGKIDEPAIWSRILTQTEITYLYAGGSPDEAQQYPYAVATGYSNKILGVIRSKINGTDVVNISKFNGG